MRNAAVRIIQIGAIVIVLVATTLTVFDLDRFLVPKEMVLHATALIAALLAFGALRRMPLGRSDWLLGGVLLLNAISAALATNRWLGFRAFAVTASAVLLFWTARALQDARIIHALAIAVVIASAMSLAEAYGLRTPFFAMTRVPGGTLGNRNFVAHLAAFGLPLLFYIALRSRFLLASCGVAIVTASLVLTRSRGAWIAAAVMLIVFVIFSVRAGFRRPAEAGPHTLTRLAGVLAFAVAGAAVALVVPNTLHWRSENPYLQSVRGVANYEEGSGRGRLTQYGRSTVMAVYHPLFGVGPGNWAVVYPHFAARNDPSIGDNNMTFNPWPSSDWMAFVSERGWLAAIALFLALASIAFASREPALIAMIAATIVAGLFDAVLLLPVPAFIVFTAAGAWSGGAWSGGLQAADGRLKPAAPLAIVLILVAAAATARSGAQLLAMSMLDQPGAAAKIDPGNYRIQKRVHPRAAHALFPYAR